MAKFYKVDNICSGNKHLPAPLVVGEIVMLIDDPKYEGTKYVKVHHNGGQNQSVFFRSYFKRYPVKKEELVQLIRGKGRKNEES